MDLVEDDLEKIPNEEKKNKEVDDEADQTDYADPLNLEKLVNTNEPRSEYDLMVLKLISQSCTLIITSGEER